MQGVTILIRKRKKCQAESLPKLDTGTKEVKNQKNSHLVAGLALFLSCDFLPLSSLLRCWPLAYCTTNRLAPTLRRGGALCAAASRSFVRSCAAATAPRRRHSVVNRQTNATMDQPVPAPGATPASICNRVPVYKLEVAAFQRRGGGATGSGAMAQRRIGYAQWRYGAQYVYQLSTPGSESW